MPEGFQNGTFLGVLFGTFLQVGRFSVVGRLSNENQRFLPSKGVHILAILGYFFEGVFREPSGRRFFSSFCGFDDPPGDHFGTKFALFWRSFFEVDFGRVLEEGPAARASLLGT